MPSDTVMLVGTLIPIIAILIGGLLLLVPIAGLTLRFALKPLLLQWAELRERSGGAEEIRLLEQRLALVEAQLQGRALAGAQEGAPGALPPAAPRAVPVTRVVREGEAG